MKRMRITLSMAQWSVKLPALVALIATQVGLLASQVTIACSCQIGLQHVHHQPALCGSDRLEVSLLICQVGTLLCCQHGAYTGTPRLPYRCLGALCVTMPCEPQ